MRRRSSSAVISAILHLEEAAKNCGLLSDEYINSSVYLLNTIATYLCMDSLGLFQPYDPLMGSIKDYIKEHIAENIQITDICQAIGIGKTKLCNMAQRYLNCSIHDYILQQKISTAKKLLIEDERTISEIATAVGFDDYNYFIVIFKRVTGVSPYRYKKQLSGRELEAL